ncbi:MAG: ABC transporter permease [Chloroflexi bacterium]|nr:MAG: ABC transporter permease [Chloroflexota bacterium]
MTNSTLEIGSTAEKRRRISFGVALVVTGLAIYLLFAVNTQPGALTTFGLNLLGSRAVEVSDLVVPALPAIYLLAAVAVFSGAYQMARGVRSTGWLVGILAFTFVTAFLLWGARDKSFNLTGMLSSSLVRATPIALAALCGVISERAAVINIGVEGIMLHAFIVIRFRVDQVVSGVAINIFGTGVTSYISSRFMQAAGDKLNNSGTFPIIAIPGLSKIPVLGPVLFENNLIVYLTILLVIVMHILLYYTPWGLRTRAVGEHPKAADTLGVNVYLMRYVNVIIGGMIAGIGGAYFTIGSVGRFDEIMTAGKGFIGLAAMIFGNWNPIGAYTSSLIFGFADSLQVKLQILRVPIPSEFLLMAPYIVTMIILTGVVGRAVPPAADGQHYEK